MPARSMDESIALLRSTKRYLKTILRSPKLFIAWLREQEKEIEGPIEAAEDFANSSIEHDDVYIRVHHLYASVKGYSQDSESSRQLFMRIECMQHGIFLLVRPAPWLDRLLEHDEKMTIDRISRLASRYYLEQKNDIESSNQ